MLKTFRIVAISAEGERVTLLLTDEQDLKMVAKPKDERELLETASPQPITFQTEEEAMAERFAKTTIEVLQKSGLFPPRYPSPSALHPPLQPYPPPLLLLLSKTEYISLNKPIINDRIILEISSEAVKE